MLSVFEQDKKTNRKTTDYYYIKEKKIAMYVCTIPSSPPIPFIFVKKLF